MPMFRKKPVVIEAWLVESAPRYEPYRDNNVRVSNWTELEALAPGVIAGIGNMTKQGFDCLGMTIKTLEGTMTAQPGDWIIRGVKGELYPCKPDIFAATYDPA